MLTPERIIDIAQALDPLCDLPRTGWVLRGVRPAESIAAHTYGVAVVAMLMVDALRAQGQVVDGERVLRMALLHDAAEARTGDIPMPNKTPGVDAALHEVERAVIADMLPTELGELWLEAERHDSLEARIVKAADKLQLMIKVLVYEKQGRGGLEEFWDNPKNFRDAGLPIARQIFETIAARAGRTAPRG